MKRTNEFDKTKLMQISTNKSVLNVYVDSFPIEKVRVQLTNYDTKQTVNTYIDFSTWLMLRDTAIVGRLFKELQQGQKTIHRGGKQSSPNYNGKPESKTVTLGMLKDKVFVNASSGQGKLSPTGAIMPDGNPTVKVAVSMTVEDLIGLFSYTGAAIEAYMPKIVKELLDNAKKGEGE